MKYFVRAVVPAFLTVEVEAEDKESAIELALDDMSLCNFAGNGGTDKIIGTTSENVSIEAGDMPLDGEIKFDIEAEEAE